MLIQQSEAAVLGMISVPISCSCLQHDCILESIFSVYAIYISGTRGARRRKYPNLVSKLGFLSVFASSSFIWSSAASPLTSHLYQVGQISINSCGSTLINKIRTTITGIRFTCEAHYFWWVRFVWYCCHVHVYMCVFVKSNCSFM